uniref:GATA zinc finger domain-containing protein 7-like isoform X2 n=1 Tax=Dermatophagoides pteronyssinus TaxID=6956 RepID=A0A6P6Y3F8_DERPT|nr:GATA zinc finger domain-containing protein 7-like isoform X2 [Dermatophagoides pteronyssinus]
MNEKNCNINNNSPISSTYSSSLTKPDTNQFYMMITTIPTLSTSVTTINHNQLNAHHHYYSVSSSSSSSSPASLHSSTAFSLNNMAKQDYQHNSQDDYFHHNHHQQLPSMIKISDDLISIERNKTTKNDLSLE